MAEILENVDATKKEKFNQKYQRLSEKKWTRDNFEANMREVMNAIDNIEDFITGLQDEIDEIQGDKPGIDSEAQRIKDEWNNASSKDFKELESRNMAGGKNPTLKELKDLYKDEVAKKLQKVNEWKTLQGELSRLAMQKLFEISKGYRQEFINSDVAENFEKHAEQIINAKMDAAKNEIKNEFTHKIADLEQVTNAARNEIKNAHAFFQTFADAIDSDELRLVSEQALDEGLEKHATDKGTMDFSGEAKEVEETKKEREEARDAASSDVFEKSTEKSDENNTSDVSQMSDKEKRNELVENWDDYYGLKTQEDVADELEMSQAWVSKVIKEEGLRE